MNAEGTNPDDGVIVREGVEVVVEDGLSDDVEPQAAEEVLHLH